MGRTVPQYDPFRMDTLVVRRCISQLSHDNQFLFLYLLFDDDYFIGLKYCFESDNVLVEMFTFHPSSRALALPWQRSGCFIFNALAGWRSLPRSLMMNQLLFFFFHPSIKIESPPPPFFFMFALFVDVIQDFRWKKKKVLQLLCRSVIDSRKTFYSDPVHLFIL